MNLFIIESPFQMLSAIEAKEQLKLKNNYLIINLTKEKRNNDQILNLLAMSSWDRVTFIPVLLTARIKLFQYIFLLRFSSLRNIYFSKFFMGEVRSDASWIFANNIQTEQSWILDDGAGTISVQERIFMNLENVNKERDKKKDIYLKIFFLKIPTRFLVNIFSMYTLPPLTNQEVIENRFEFVKGKMKDISEDDESVYFIGSNLVRTELLTEIDFIRAFTQVFNYYKKQGKKIKYILHRRENRKILEQHFSNIEIVQFDNLLELELLIKKIKPLHIASFYSAALFSLKKIYDITLIDSFLLDIEHIDDIHRQAVQACYDFNKEHMNIIDLGDI